MVNCGKKKRQTDKQTQNVKGGQKQTAVKKCHKSKEKTQNGKDGIKTDK